MKCVERCKMSILDHISQSQDTCALGWYIRHQKHVHRLLENCVESCPPGAEDAGHPELWKPAHWNWFFAAGGEA